MSSAPAPFVITSNPLPYYRHMMAAEGMPGTQEPEVPAPMFYGVTGFRIPALAVAPSGYTQTPETLVQQILYRFQRYARELHSTENRSSIALQLMAHPERATMGSQVSMVVLCRTAEETAAMAETTAARVAQHTFNHFPKEGLFSYGTPLWLSESDLRRALFQPSAVPNVDMVELRKYQERQVWDRRGHTQYIQYVPHRFWPDAQMDPWLVLIENLSRVSKPVAIRVELIPTKIDEASGLEEFATAGRWFGLIDEDFTRLASKPDVEVQDAKTGQFKEEGLRVETKAAMSSAARIAYIKRGKHAFDRLLENADQLFAMRVLIAAEDEVPNDLVQSVRTALSSPSPTTQDVAMGWIRPEAVRPKPSLSDRGPALRHLNWMAQTRWGRDERADGWYGPDLRFLATAEEASSLFHLPIAEKAGKTSALSTAETPFIIPPEVIDAGRFDADERKIRAGYLYQREILLNPDNVGEQAQAFSMPLTRLMMPSLLVGAPGSGKSNMALYLLLQLWRDHKMPFLVLDPSTGQEYRLLLGSKMKEDPTEPIEDHESTLHDDFIVYTVGDNEGCPLRFNPFAVPPGVTVRSHITRLMAGFKSAYSMPDPFPAVFESAMQRLYTNEKYLGAGNAWGLDDKGDKSDIFPCLSDFAEAMNDELEENVLPGYKGSGEATGILKGGTTIRIESLYKNLGHILNVRKSDPEFFQHMLRRPVVIELGALGDTTSIALVMAFLLTQLVGHVEHAFNVMRDEGETRLHLLLIEEAHRLLSGEGGDSARGKSAEDLSVMLAECRKFGQGIMILDQRPSSLVGGVLDNANIKILTRLSDRHGFERLAMELNLSEDQQRHARTRLGPGDAIMADWKSGQPVLIRSGNVSKGLKRGRLGKEAEREQMLANAARWKVLSPPAEAYITARQKAEQAAAAGGGAATGATTGAGPGGAKPAEKSTLKSRDWMRREVEEAAGEVDAILTQARGNSILYHHSKDKLKETNGDLDAALAIVTSQMNALQAEYVGVMTKLWEKMKLAALGIVVEEHEARGDLKDITPKIKDRREKPLPDLKAAAAQPHTRPTAQTSQPQSAAAPNGQGARPQNGQPATVQNGQAAPVQNGQPTTAPNASVGSAPAGATPGAES